MVAKKKGKKKLIPKLNLILNLPPGAEFLRVSRGRLLWYLSISKRKYWFSDTRHLVNWRQSCKRECSNDFSSFQLHYVRLADRIWHYGNQQMKTILISIENKCKKGGLEEEPGEECFPGQPDRLLLRPFNHLLT